MTSATAQPASARPRHVWAWVVISMLALGLSCAFFVVLGCLRMEMDVRVARDHAIRAYAPAGNWSKRIELGLGGAVLPLARVASAFLDVPPEARACLAATRRLEIGVYQIRSRSARDGARGSIEEMTAALTARGWMQAVSVRSETSCSCRPIACGRGRDA